MTHAQIAKGVIVTMKGYTREAEDLAKSHNIELVNEAELREMIETSGAHFDPAFQQALNDHTKYCPRCEAPMVLRRGYSEFWGCSRFPNCRYKMKVE
jgi:RecB family exonuclease